MLVVGCWGWAVMAVLMNDSIFSRRYVGGHSNAIREE